MTELLTLKSYLRLSMHIFSRLSTACGLQVLVFASKPAIAVRQPDPALRLAPQYDQLMSECRILCLKPAL